MNVVTTSLAHFSSVFPNFLWQLSSYPSWLSLFQSLWTASRAQIKTFKTKRSHKTRRCQALLLLGSKHKRFIAYSNKGNSNSHTKCHIETLSWIALFQHCVLQSYLAGCSGGLYGFGDFWSGLVRPWGCPLSRWHQTRQVRRTRRTQVGCDIGHCGHGQCREDEHAINQKSWVNALVCTCTSFISKRVREIKRIRFNIFQRCCSLLTWKAWMSLRDFHNYFDRCAEHVRAVQRLSCVAFHKQPLRSTSWTNIQQQFFDPLLLLAIKISEVKEWRALFPWFCNLTTSQPFALQFHS